MPRPPNPRWRARLGLLIALAIGAIVVGVAIAIRFAPSVSDDELENARRVVDAADIRNTVASCRRPVLEGEPMRGSGSSEAHALIRADGELATCLALHGRVREALDGRVGSHTWGWAIDGGPMRSDLSTEASHLVGQLALNPPPLPRDDLPPVMEETARACGRLPELIHHAVTHESLCAWDDDGPHGLEDAAIGTWLSTMRLVRVVARDRAARGQPYEALLSLLDAARLAQDLGRGRVPAVTRLSAIAAEAIVLSEVQTLLAAELALDDMQIVELRRRLEVLAQTVPPPRDMLVGEIVYGAQYLAAPNLGGGTSPIPGTGEAAEAERRSRQVFVLAAQNLHDPRVTCEPVGDVHACLDTLAAVVADQPDAPDPMWVEVLGERFLAARVHGAFRKQWLESMIRYVQVIGTERARFLALRALVGFHARRRAGPCPGVGGFAPEDLRSPELGGDLFAYELVDDQQFEIHAPSALIGRPGERIALPLVLTVCPGLPLDQAGRWSSEEASPR
ncbi:MAG: hypothetical protein AB7S26_23255 [Sandaracinaceae bacterium]